VVAGHRGGHRGLRLALGVAIAGHPAGCGQPPGPTALVESPATTPAPSVGAVILPGADALLPDRVAGATAWTEMGSLPNDFDGWRLDDLWTRALCWRGVDDQLSV
jgi:hypothetical protein